MKILFIGDISGRSGRKVLKELLPSIKNKYKPDIVIANAENSAHGIGITKDVLTELLSYGVDFFTSGDHVWHNKEFIDELQDDSLPIIRPYNYEKTEKLPGVGYKLLDLGPAGKLLVVNLLGQSFMKDHVRSPFWTMDELLEDWNDPLLKDLNILIDFHAESSAEKLCLAGYLKDRGVSAIVGTHTHVPTADQRIIGELAYVGDVGMAGPLNASPWIKFDNAIHNFKYPFKMSPEIEEHGEMVLNSVLIELEGGKAKKIERVDKFITF